MKQKLKSYRKLEKDLISQINLCNNYKALIENTLRNLHSQYKTGQIDRRTHDEQVHKFLEGKSTQDWYDLYDNHIGKCHNSLAYTKQKIQEVTAYLAGKRNSISRSLLLFSVILLILGIIAFFQPPITGLFGYEELEKQIVSEDGYTVEGTRWLDINGARSYERCLKVTTPNNFDAVKLIAKVTNAGEKKDLALRLYSHNEQADEPATLLDSCRVTDYENVWKSCTINSAQLKASYWICAASLSGERSETHYTIAYQTGDEKKTALWTGEHWQKLDQSSYTLKAQFIENEN